MEREPELDSTDDAPVTPQGPAANGNSGPVPSFFSRTVTDDIGEDDEPRDSMSAFISRTMAAVAEHDDPEEDQNIMPRAPRTFAEVGLSKAFLTDLALKIIHYSGTPSMAQLVRRLGLAQDIVSQLLTSLTEERFIEILSQSDLYTGNYKYRLSERGQVRVAEALERSRYAGPAPVTAEQYSQVMKRLLDFKQENNNRARIKAILNDLVLSGDVSDALARALFSGKSVMIHGPSGNGKTVLLERFAEDLGGFALVPYSIYAYGQVIRVFDQSIHEPLEKFEAGNFLKDDAKRDRRWIVVKRPAIVLGAEMDREALELGYDPSARFYQAPPHIKAQTGALIIDDLGRQRIETRDLLTRWLIPLERGWDSLTLVTGEKLVVPFRIQLLFATNVPIKKLADDALLRRVLYKVMVPNPDEESFGEVLRRVCRQKAIRVADDALEYAVKRLYNEPGLHPRASHARDILDILIESASYDGREPILDKESFDRVFRLFLANEANEELESGEVAA
jgi:predicted ATPase with chaperone activity